MLGIGSKLQIETAVPATYEDIVGVDTVNPSLGSLAMEDDTDFDSPDNATAHSPGLLTWGEVAFEGNYTGAATQVSCITAMHGRTLKNFKVLLPTAVAVGGKTFTFSGYVTRFDITTPTAAKMRFSGTITVTAKPTLA